MQHALPSALVWLAWAAPAGAQVLPPEEMVFDLPETPSHAPVQAQPPAQANAQAQAQANPNVQVHIEAPRRDGARPPELVEPPPPAAIFLHGFRIGYLTIMDVDGAVAPDSSETYADRYGIRSAHMFMLGYEATWRMIGYDWLNILLIGNVLIAGLEQSRFFPSANLLLGFEIAELTQLGIGASFTPTKDEPAHMVFAAGFTPLIGSFYVPLHVFFVPDIDGHHKLGVTLGVNFF
jgi:hypothetical protein